ncbi:MAG TPA: lipopolysaccharide heptosyltransferase II [Thermoanaerobaculia bacterium]|nr:lipopolysaccharide heptosyltransferase II [Thermoanaerobaculia bacterium]
MACETVVIGLNWVGDNVLAIPAYKALQHRFRSEGGIAVAAPRNVAALLEASGIFRQVIGWNGSTRNRIAALRAGGGFRRAVILPNSFRAAMVALAAGIGERWGYPTDLRRLLLTHPVAPPEARGHQLDDYTPLLAALNAPRVVDDIPTIKLPPAIRERGRRQLIEIGLHLDRPIIAIHAGGLYGRAKHWGDARYVEIIKRLRLEGFDVVLLTSPGERDQAQRIATTCNGVPIAGHQGDVLELAAAISQCAALITNDSGPLHVAAALAVPSVSIFGPTDPGRTVIPGATHVVSRALECQPCYQRECPLRHHRCMSEVSVDEVFTAAVGLFAEVEPEVPAHHLEA